MSKIAFSVKLIFDTDEVWHNISEFEGAFAKFLEANQLVGEKILTGDDEVNKMVVLLTPVPQEPRGTTVPQTPKQQLKNVQSKIK